MWPSCTELAAPLINIRWPDSLRASFPPVIISIAVIACFYVKVTSPSSLLIFHFCKNDSVWFSSWKRTGCLGKDGGMEEKAREERKKCLTPNGFYKCKALMRFEITINYASRLKPHHEYSSPWYLWGNKIGWNQRCTCRFFFFKLLTLFLSGPRQTPGLISSVYCNIL